MKSKKFIGSMLIVLLGIIFLSSSLPTSPKSKRIMALDWEQIGGFTYYIIRVDGHEYITSSHSGIVHSENCVCKKIKR